MPLCGGATRQVAAAAQGDQKQRRREFRAADASVNESAMVERRDFVESAGSWCSCKIGENTPPETSFSCCDFARVTSKLLSNT